MPECACGTLLGAYELRLETIGDDGFGQSTAAAYVLRYVLLDGYGMTPITGVRTW